LIGRLKKPIFLQELYSAIILKVVSEVQAFGPVETAVAVPPIRREENLLEINDSLITA
jgi:hypothetical protein